MNLLLLLAIAVPLSCLAFVSCLALLGVMTLGAVINVIAITRAAGTEGAMRLTSTLMSTRS
jgi:hypothetical protein